MPPAPVAEPPAPAGTPPKPRRRIGWIITVILLSLALIATGAVLALTLVRLSEARDEIDHQQEIIEEKQTFGLAADELMSTAKQFDGLPYATLVDTDYYASLLARAWDHRWNANALSTDTKSVQLATEELETVLAAATADAGTNATGTFLEAKTDEMGRGFVKTSTTDTDALCEQDVWGCVDGEDPYTIHYDEAETASAPYMTDWIRTGLAFHEYAHVLQFTNPGPTATADKAFGGDWETMADCYALTFLDGWTLDHTIWVSDYEYWEVSVGYGYTCDESQRQVVRDWVAALGYSYEPISQ